MKLALQVAGGGKGQTHPNPAVGAVVVKSGRIVGIGAHLKAGEPHAEVHAIQMAGDEAEGSTVYVTLEPCSHYGKTPPCADLLVRAGVSKVYVAVVDANPKVGGGGIAKLRNAGVEVHIGLMKEEAERQNAAFFYFIKTGMPFVTLKQAVSLDGKIATVGGQSQWITGPEARYDGHRYRDENDAILVGVNTVVADDPSLTTRLEGESKNPVRVVLDRKLRTPLESKLVRDGKAETWIVTTRLSSPGRRNEFENQGVKIIEMPGETIEIAAALKELASRNILSLLVEGGAGVNGSFLKAGYVQQVITYVAPKLLGGREAPVSFTGSGFVHLDDAMRLTFHSVERLGEDLKIIAIPKERK
jgi:diaminohydroxyphosphoribosylaminopyrimidine deaminase/5-amino-6-(5-phosphoribosylamino)uracil reductase